MESEVLWVKHDISNSLNQLQFFSILFYLPLTVSNNWHNTTRRWKKVCVIKLQLYKSPWESAYYLSETCRRYLTKAIYQLSWNEYNKAWLNTNLAKTPNLFTVQFQELLRIVRIFPGGVLPHMGYIGACRGIGYGFWGSRFLNRVSFFTLLFLCPWCGP